jgi:uncharacterized protein
MERRIVYFEERKPENTEVAFGLVRDRLAGSGIDKVVLASTTGATAKKALEFFGPLGVKLVVVGHQFDFKRPVNPFSPEAAARIRDAGHVLHFGTMLFHTEGLYESKTPVLMGNLLRCFSQGVKVCFEIVMMAVDAGHVAVGEQVIVVAGTARGADTALVIRAASSQNLKKLRVNEILCKPLEPMNIDEVLEEYRQPRK